MNSQHQPPNQPMLSQAPPAIPLPNGRSAQINPYPHSPQPAPYYPGYQYQYPLRLPQQWAPYNYPAPVQRTYQPYPSMTPYPMPQHVAPMRPSPHQTTSSSSIRSAQRVQSPSSNSSLHPPSSARISTPDPHLAPPTPPPPPRNATQPTHRLPFYPPLPWQSFEGNFPNRVSRRRRKTPAPQSPSVPVELPSHRDSAAEEDEVTEVKPAVNGQTLSEVTSERLTLETPPTSHAPSEVLSTEPTTPSSAAPPQQTTPKNHPSNRQNGPIVPIVPAIPNFPVSQRRTKRTSVSTTSEAINGETPSNADLLNNAVRAASQIDGNAATDQYTKVGSASPPPIKVAPKSWADLVRAKQTPIASATTQAINNADAQSNGFNASKTGFLADALSSYDVRGSNESTKVAFLEPRGLVNTGNMCYMNAVSCFLSILRWAAILIYILDSTDFGFLCSLL